MFEINLQLFGGGGSKSGLGGGGGSSGQAPTIMYYTYGFMRSNEKVDRHTIKAKSRAEADKKAEKYRREEGYIKKSKNPTVRTPEEYEALRNKKK